MATMYAVDSPKNPNLDITEENLPQFVWEIMRYFGGVPSIPYAKGKHKFLYDIHICSLRSKDLYYMIFPAF